eukprot:scaffold43654_cov19-Tisochrysis_lutea.AAC.1
MAGQRNPQPCPHRHARKLASTIELEQQLAAIFEEGEEGEEATALKVPMIAVTALGVGAFAASFVFAACL